MVIILDLQWSASYNLKSDNNYFYSTLKKRDSRIMKHEHI